MQRMFFKAITFSLMISVGLVFQAVAADQNKPAKPPKTGQLSGNVNMVNKEKSEIGLQKGNVRRVVVYSSSTKFNMGSSKKSTPSSVDQVKDGNYMYCGGTWDGLKLAATTCIFRASK